MHDEPRHDIGEGAIQGEYAANSTYRVSFSSGDFARVAALAERLGVEPGVGTGPFVLSGGKPYSITALCHAMLDRLESEPEPDTRPRISPLEFIRAYDSLDRLERMAYEAAKKPRH
jgi:fermentation-respiration switch protein FrsA (DUF1100 family)